jgi:hypothetical protein
MKIVEVNELKDPGCEAPFYNIIDKTKLGEADPRACGCASIALLNAILILKKRLKIRDNLTPFDELRHVQEMTDEQDNGVRPENVLEFVDQHPIFNSCRMLVMNPNAMNEEIFLRIFLRRLYQGNIAIAMMEVPEKAGTPATDVLNHVSFIHCEGEEIYFDGLRINLNFLIRAFYYSRPTTLVFFGVNSGGKNVLR